MFDKYKTSLYERLGFNFLYRGDYPRADKWFGKLREREGDSVRVLRDLRLLAMARGDAEAAAALLTREEKRFGPSFQRHSALADLAYARGDRAEAKRRYGLALAEPEAAPDGEMAAWRGLLEERIRRCATESAYGAVRRSMELYRKGEEARERGEAEEAISAFEESAALDPTNWSALNNAGSVALGRLKDPARAAALFERALEVGRSPQVARNLQIARRAAKR